jgi:hypothetical protein
VSAEQYLLSGGPCTVRSWIIVRKGKNGKKINSYQSHSRKSIQSNKNHKHTQAM